VLERPNLQQMRKEGSHSALLQSKALEEEFREEDGIIRIFLKWWYTH
jgi:hypothetical protein